MSTDTHTENPDDTSLPLSRPDEADPAFRPSSPHAENLPPPPGSDAARNEERKTPAPRTRGASEP